MGRGSQSSGAGAQDLNPLPWSVEKAGPCPWAAAMHAHPAPSRAPCASTPGKAEGVLGREGLWTPLRRPDSELRAPDLQSVLGSVELMSKSSPQGVPHSPSQGLPGKTSLLSSLSSEGRVLGAGGPLDVGACPQAPPHRLTPEACSLTLLLNGSQLTPPPDPSNRVPETPARRGSLVVGV